MYTRFFGFHEKPFKLVPDPDFIFLSRSHEEVLAHLNYALNHGEGFVEIIGEVGTGKTTLCRLFLENLDENTEAAYIFNPKLDARQLLEAINDEFGIPSGAESLKTLIDRLNAFLMEKKSEGKRVILLVDEAQNLTPDVLEQLRLLSNLETTTSKLLQIILVGQPELGELLDSDVLRQLNQRINLSCHLNPLNYAETRDYIRHRIHIASRKPGPFFSAAAYRSIFGYSRGVPRLINIACDRALLTAFSLGQHRITNPIVKRALRELEGRHRRRRKPIFDRENLIIGLLVILVFLVGVVIAGQALLNRISTGSFSPAVHHKIEKPLLAEVPEQSRHATMDQSRETHSPGSDLQPDRTEPPAEAPGGTQPNAANENWVLQPLGHDLQARVLSTDPLNSRIGALTAVLEAWGAATPPLTGPLGVVGNDTFFRISARHSELEALRVRGNLKLIKKLNLPAILELTPREGSDSRFMALVGFAADDIQLSDGGTTVSVPPDSLEGLWNGVAYILWKNFFNYVGVIPVSSPGEVIVSLKVHLNALGYPIPEMTPAYDTATRFAVESIQARNGLEVDGVVGPLTKIALYNEDPWLTIPRLIDNTPGRQR